MTFLCDLPEYIDSLSWLGTPVQYNKEAVIKRELQYSMCDARGSWPYQSLPPISLLDELSINDIINLTVVIKPDINIDHILSFKNQINHQYSCTVIPLKPHLCHSSELQPASQTYSSRTIKRLSAAIKEFTVQREEYSSIHFKICEWQNKLRTIRKVPQISSPDNLHFYALADIKSSLKNGIGCITLRHRGNGEMAGILLAIMDNSNNSWHAHSALTSDLARSHYGSYLLFHSFSTLLNGNKHWLGGQPGSSSGNGVFNFKRKFANKTENAHIISVDILPDHVENIRSLLGTYSYLPSYRNPEIELQLQ